MDKRKTVRIINDLLERANDLAVQLVESEARKMLRGHSNLDEFIMAMGSAFFTVKGGDIARDSICPYDRQYMKSFDEMLDDLNEQFKICGFPMRFTAYGEKITDW